MRTTSEIIALAQDVLSQRYGGSQQLSEIETLSGSGTSTVVRAKVGAQPFFQHRTIIVKYVPETGDPLDDAALYREVAAYQFTTSLTEEVRPGPMLLAYDLGRRILVLSDSGQGDTFADLLNQSDPEIRQGILRNLGTALGRMHAGTADKEAHFDILLSRMLKAHPEAAASRDLRDRSLGPAILIGLELVDNSGIEVPEAVRVLARTAARRLNSGRSRAFTPFDLSPDNIIVAKRTEFLDYEWAGFRDVAFDVACVIGGFPQFVGVGDISVEESEAFIRAWVEEVRHVWPATLNEDELVGKVMSALVGWALSSVAVMHFGSLTSALTALDVTSAETMSSSTHLLRLPEEGGFSEDERAIRRDFRETFGALARFADISREPDAAVVADFARRVVERVTDSGR